MVAADGVKRYRFQLHLLWLPYELKKGLKNYRRPKLPYEYYYTTVTNITVTPLVKGVPCYRMVLLVVYINL